MSWSPGFGPRRSKARAADRGSSLSPQAFQILLALHDEPRHGYAVIQDVEARTGGEIRLTASTLYDALARMVDQGLIEPVDSPPDETDSRRRYYRVTSAGRELVAAETRRLARLLEAARARGIAET